jgi:predicted kinase
VEIAAKGGHAVIADATFMDFAHRAMVEAAAASACVPFLGIWLTAPLAVLEQRVAARSGDASDATADVLHAAAANDPGPGGWHAVDASDGPSAEKAVLTLAEGLAKSHIVF